MADTRPHIRFRTPTRVFDVQEPTMGDASSVHSRQSRLTRLFSRLSLNGSVKPRASRAQSLDSKKTAMTERPPIPTMMPPSDEVYATPLPKLSMSVLSITMLGEFLSSNVSTPFILFMVKGFNQFHDEAEIAFWTGILVSSFFLTQFVTSLLWSTIAERHGRRVVLTTSLLGAAITCFLFGTCTTLEQALCARLMQGVFAGAVGVARGSVAFITDPSNEGRAYAILGFCWGMGGVAGAIIGGAFESPAVKWPQIFGDTQIFATYPYLLPCSIAAVITFTGSFLACFTGYDGGPREGAIRLPPEKDDLPQTIPEEESAPPSPQLDGQFHRPGLAESVRSIAKRLSNLSNYLPGRGGSASQASTAAQIPTIQPAVPLASSVTQAPGTSSRVSRADGSAYGYSGNFRSRLTSNASAVLRRRSSLAGSLGWRRGSYDVRRESMDSQNLNFAQRLLMANQDTVSNIADLWVAAAMNVDNEDPFFESDDEFIEDEQPGGRNDGDGATIDGPQTQRGRGTSRKYLGMSVGSLSQQRLSRSQRPSRGSRPSHSHVNASRPTSSSKPAIGRQPSFSIPHSASSVRRPSTSVPSIFSHPGVEMPRAVLDAQDILLRLEEGAGPLDTLHPIIESRQPSDSGASSDIEATSQKPPSLISQLPILVIIQYGILALHTTAHDQVFMSYVVSDISAGGLGLTAGHFAQLIALMSLAQIAFQFYLYPNLGPPRGKFSHLAMYRIGAVLFIPAYLLVTPLRPFATTSGGDNFIVMGGLISFTAVRYCGITFGYTAISILLNYMTPPSVVGYANGVAQSIASLARCAGPALGGYAWSLSVQDDPSGFFKAFIVCAAICAFGLAKSFLIR